VGSPDFKQALLERVHGENQMNKEKWTKLWVTPLMHPGQTVISHAESPILTQPDVRNSLTDPVNAKVANGNVILFLADKAIQIKPAAIAIQVPPRRDRIIIFD
jgi:hypothetical protein